MKLRLINETKAYDFSDYTFIMPAVSVGHVGQLAVDLLLEALEPSPVRYALVDHKAFSPVTGLPCQMLETSDLVSPCEIYVADEQKIVIMQIRSSLLKPYEDDMLNQFMDWYASHKFQRLVLLSSTFAENRLDCQINHRSPLRYFGTNLTAEVSDNLKQLGLLELEKKETLSSNKETVWEVSGSGFTKRLFQICTERSVEVMCILAFSFEGGTMFEASQIVDVLKRWGNLPLKSVNLPESWEMFSKQPHPVTIFP